MSQTHPYALIDSGDGRKLEKFGSFILDRPCAHAVWKKTKPLSTWEQAHGFFSRDPENRWIFKSKTPSSWDLEEAGLQFHIMPTDFGHLGIFPEQKASWEWIQNTIKTAPHKNDRVRVLNLFAYSGGSTLAAAKAGAAVCHLDASKGMVAWARENALLNDLEKAPIRWIVEDVRKFIARELKRGSRYEAVILDPPTFGRGAKGEFFKIEEEILSLLADCRQLLSPDPLFILFSCHTPGFTPLVMHHLLAQTMEGAGGLVESGEMVLEGNSKTFDLPSGSYSRWIQHAHHTP